VCPAFAHLPVRNLVGQTDLTGMVELLSQAAVVVTHDSGPLHLATITRAGLVTLFGPTPANACIPLGRPKTIVHEPGNRVCCSPCYDGRDYADCQQALCMEASTVEAVTQSVLALLSLQPHRPPKPHDPARIAKWPLPLAPTAQASAAVD
jgi:heptosyltransferase-2